MDKDHVLATISNAKTSITHLSEAAQTYLKTPTAYSRQELETWSSYRIDEDCENLQKLFSLVFNDQIIIVQKRWYHFWKK